MSATLIVQVRRSEAMNVFDHEKLDVYRTARRSATECAAVLDVGQATSARR